MKTLVSRCLAVLAIGSLAACSTGSDATLHKDPAALHGDYSGKDFSGAFAVVPVAGDIPHVPASNGKEGRWAQDDKDQILYLDAHCQKKLFEALPGWAQAIVKEGGWQALATAVGEGGFAALFPGAQIARYFVAGLGYGLPSGMNTGRYRQDGAEKGSQGYCVALQVWDTGQRYNILDGLEIVPWTGDGQTTLPAVKDPNTAPLLPHVDTPRPRPPVR